MQFGLKALKALNQLSKVSTMILLMFNPSPVFHDLPELVVQHNKILIRAANRIGKTRHVAWVASQLMVSNPGYRVRIIGPTTHHIHNVLGKYLAEFLGPYLKSDSYYMEGKGWNGGRARTIRIRNGSVCDMRSLQDKPEAHSGTSFHLVIFDEPPSLAHYTENAARLVDTSGTMIVAATMVNRPVRWLREMVQGSEQDPTGGRTMHATGWLQIVATFSAESCPWYTEEQITDWLHTMSLTSWEEGQRIYAQWDGVTAQRLLAGVPEQAFSRNPPHGNVSLGIGIDHGEVVGHQSAVLIAFRGTQCWIIDEYKNLTSTTPEQDVAQILEMLKRNNVSPTAIDLAIGDIGHVAGHVGWRINEAMTAAFQTQTFSIAPPFVIKTADKSPGSVDFGHRLVNYAGVRGDLRIHPRCVNTGQAIRHWKGGRKGIDGELSHTADAMRYIMCAAIGHQKVYAKLRFT